MLKENEGSCEFLDLLMDGYRVTWQKKASDVKVEELDLIARLFDKVGYDVAMVIEGNVITIFRKMR